MKGFSISSRRLEEYVVHVIEVVKLSGWKQGTLEALVLLVSNADPVMESYYPAVSIQGLNFQADCIHMRKKGELHHVEAAAKMSMYLNVESAGIQLSSQLKISAQAILHEN